jgi:hypothetical protein
MRAPKQIQRCPGKSSRRCDGSAGFCISKILYLCKIQVAGDTYSALGTETAFTINPDVLSHDVTLLVQIHVFGQL